ncbi:hypothetical protein BDZ45DRAFT_722694 [Acephala macrosclerotiorum]|nr:hypothetical protein BDZ45DRAFT_722694 [Acephala macrosclerotiorum]
MHRCGTLLICLLVCRSNAFHHNCSRCRKFCSPKLQPPVNSSRPVTSVVTKTKTVTVSSFKIAATTSALSPTKQLLVSDDRATSPNLFGILVTPKEIVDGSGVWRLSTGYGQDYKGRFTQQDAGQQGLSEWIWTDTAANIDANGWKYIDFIVDPFTLAVTAKGTDSGNTILQVCQLKGGPYYLDLSGAAGLAEHTTGSPCFPVVLSAVPLK